MARRESLSEIRAANPELSLTGNIISATFNIPHAVTYHKGGAWVSAFSSLTLRLRGRSKPRDVKLCCAKRLVFDADVSELLRLFALLDLLALFLLILFLPIEYFTFPSPNCEHL